MHDVPVNEVANIIAGQMKNGGVFLCTRADGQDNVMTIGWGGLTVFFGADCFLVPVRTSRYTYGMLQKNGEFTVSIPLHDMRRELGVAGSKSARDVDKFSGFGMTAVPAQQVDAPIVSECELQIECTPLGSVTQTAEQLNQDVLDRFYASRDMHTFFLGKIVRCYYKD